MRLLSIVAIAALLGAVDSFQPASGFRLVPQKTTNKASPAAAAAHQSPLFKSKGGALSATAADPPSEQPWTKPRLHNNPLVRSGLLLGALALAGLSSPFDKLPSTACATLHLLSFGTWFGTVFYTTFIAGITMFKALPRQTFGKLQSKLFPKYFSLCSLCVVLQLITLSRLPGIATTVATRALGVSLGMTLLNQFILEPKSTKIMFDRYELENSGDTESEDYKKLRASFGKLHATAATTRSRLRIPSGKSKLRATRRSLAPFSEVGFRIRGSKSLRSKLNDNDNNEPEEEDPIVDKAQLRGMSAALASCYFTVMAAKCALPVCLVPLTSKNGLQFPSTSAFGTQQLMANLLALSTIAIAVGKLLLGPIIDSFGGVLSLQVALSALALLLGTISVGKSFQLFAVCWIFVDFIFSSCWAGCINAIHQSFPKSLWGKRVGMLAAAARSGNAAAFAFFAWLLSAAGDLGYTQSWRLVFGAACVLQTIPVGLLLYYGPKKTTSSAAGGSVKSKTTIRDSLGALKRVSSTVPFWGHLISRSMLMVFASFLLFVPTLMSQVYGADPSLSAQVGSIFALGCLVSVTFGSNAYAKLSKRKRAASIVALLGLSTLTSGAQLGHMLGKWHLSTRISAASMFLWGLSVAIPFYIPGSLYALSKGGLESSATIADVFDMGGFALLAAFNGYVAGIQHAVPAAWIATFQFTTGCALVALVSMVIAVLSE